MDLNKIKAYRGNPLMMGATVIGNTVNFAITARLGSKCELVLYEKGKNNEAARIPFENAQVIGNVFAMSIEGLDYKKYDYNFSIDGKIVTDAYAKALSGKEKWGIVPTRACTTPPSSGPIWSSPPRCRCLPVWPSATPCASATASTARSSGPTTFC